MSFPADHVSDVAPSTALDRRVAWIIGLCTAAFGMLVQFEIYAQHLSGSGLGASGTASAPVFLQASMIRSMTR